MQFLNRLLSPILGSVVEQMLLDGASPAKIVEAVLEASLAKCESDLSALASEAIDRNDEISAESDHWLKQSSDWKLSESDTAADFDAHDRDLTYHDEKIEHLIAEQKSIEERAVALVAIELQALRMLDDLRRLDQATSEAAEAATDQIVERCVIAHDPFDHAPNPERHTHVLRSLVELGRIGLLPKAPKSPKSVESSTSRALGPGVRASGDFGDEVPF